MANRRHLELLEEGADAWNEWARRRTENVDLRDADLTGRQLMGFDFSDADLKRVKLRRANLRKAKFNDAYLRRADLTGADLTEASMRTANCRHAVLRGATVKDAYLRRVDLSYVDLRGADLSGANLEYARLVDVNLNRATLKNCCIYGISVWNVVGAPKEQSNLIITPSRAIDDDKAPRGRTRNRQVITVDDLEVAQFVNLLLHNDKIRNVIDTVGNKGVLILGRFSP